MMPPTFIQGDGFRLTPVEPADTKLVAGHPHPGPGEDEILLAARRDGDLLCVVALAPIRWPARTATIRFGPRAPEDARLAGAILSTVTRYALDELGLRRLDLFDESLDAAPLGYTREGDGHWRFERDSRSDAPTL